jgi:hypothetical protein
MLPSHGLIGVVSMMATFRHRIALVGYFIRQSRLPPTHQREFPMAKPKNKVIISCAITGGIHTPNLSDARCLTPVTLRGSQSMRQKPGRRSSICMRVIRKRVRQRVAPDIVPAVLPVVKRGRAVINLTTGGSWI